MDIPDDSTIPPKTFVLPGYKNTGTRLTDTPISYREKHAETLMCLTLYHTISSFNLPDRKAFGNSVEKRVNACNQHFSPFFNNVFYLPKASHII